MGYIRKEFRGKFNACLRNPEFSTLFKSDVSK